MRMAA